MSYKIVGAICVITACGGFGFLLAAQHIQRIRLLRQLIAALDYMECELQYRSTALPELCLQTAQQSCGKIRTVFAALSEELEAQISPNVSLCMATALERCVELPAVIQDMYILLGRSLGKFDLHGQLKGLDETRRECRNCLQTLLYNKDTRIRSYQTLGLCAGAAIAILFV